jgi:hypothetical protein
VHESIGRQALADGFNLSAGQHLTTAAVCYHFAKFVFVLDVNEMRAAHMKAVECRKLALPHLRPPGEYVRIPFEGRSFAGVLRRPAGVIRPPIVIMCMGLDSAKEEMDSYESLFLARGLTLFVFFLALFGLGLGGGVALFVFFLALFGLGLGGGVALLFALGGVFGFGGGLAFRVARLLELGLIRSELLLQLGLIGRLARLGFGLCLGGGLALGLLGRPFGRCRARFFLLSRAPRFRRLSSRLSLGRLGFGALFALILEARFGSKRHFQPKN